ncbi:G-type lectin S-receptor-like serine/threonine-protein kinase At5g35370 [Salvia miltiorrhiza]|uniref:G-type lectin S-receptor-like serine/threonine-protein kinase At5g35370 n=1 Tax=Salvia miltiorrhiza TaxID=226208 RepID=UPI0025ACCC36|nr:G-type lectin S-receptor-like serine/threonine-protein kinase At5g35370 [Salvia miltiorrhiza]
MGRPLLLPFCFILLSADLILAGPISIPSIQINFTASYLQFIDNSGAFLASQKGSFEARITNSKPESKSFYFVVIHVASHTIVWSANRNRPISLSSQLRLTEKGLTLYNDTGLPIWSTPPNPRPVSSLHLLESGNLILLDSVNSTVWQSFDFPTDLLVVGQPLRVGKSLVAPLGGDDGELSEGGYRLVVGDDDAVLQWNGMVYWKLSMDGKAFRDANFAVEFLIVNTTGLFLMGGENGRRVVMKRIFDTAAANSSDFGFAKLDFRGLLSVVSFNSVDRTSKELLERPNDKCQIPMICRKLDVCSNGGSCWCAPGFHNDPKINNGDCVPTDTSLVLPDSCNNTWSSASDYTNIKYFSLRSDLDYFSNDFTDPVIRDVNVSFCQNLCSKNCSCLGVFFTETSGSCYMIRNYLGSMKSGSGNRAGYVKMVAVGVRTSDVDNNKDAFPTIATVLLPSSVVLAIAVVALVCLRRRQRRRFSKKIARSKLDYDGDEEVDFVSIPGLPVRIDYEELAEATQDFKNQIGSGGFGTVYKGTLRDGSEVAVKKITCLGSQGKREFLTEIAVIGKIHHVNLVRLKGFCAHGAQKLLVYEYMKRGSLDRSLFQGEPVLEWKERCEIAVGAARGLAYLHSGCEHKIIHCDVKPENILLHHESQVKISDFGLSKLLTPEEQSGLFTTLRGTRGYLAPEWLTSSAISDKSDVYSYGMVLLEIIRGGKNSSPQTWSDNSGSATLSPTGDSVGQRRVYFPLLALQMHEERKYLELADPRLVGRVRSHEVEKMVRVALCCVHEDPNLRPSMTNVVGMLEGAVPLVEPRLESLNFLRFYGRRFMEASTLGDGTEANEFMLYRQPTSNTSSTVSYNSFSYMSSHQVSGPR